MAALEFLLLEDDFVDGFAEILEFEFLKFGVFDQVLHFFFVGGN